MKIRNFVLACYLISSFGFADDLKVSINNNFASAFVSNSTSLNWVDGPVWMPSTNLSYKDGVHNYNLGAWAVVNLDGARGFDNSADANNQVESNQGQVTEWDLFLSYKYTDFEVVDVSAGYIRYEFQQLDAHTSDIFVKFDAGNWYLNPSLNVLYDTDGHNQGAHVILSVSHTVKLGDLALLAGASASWADKDYARAYFSDDQKNHAGISNWSLSLSHAIALGKITMTPKIAYYRLTNSRGVLGKSYQQWGQLGYEGNKSEQTVASLNINYAF